MKKLKNITAIILIVAILSSITAVAHAETNVSETKQTSFSDVKGAAETEAAIVKELPEERTEYTKEFLLDDGTKMIAEYEQPIHYQDDKDNWLEYDNTLDSNLKNRSSDLRVDLSEKADAKELVKVNTKNYSVSWGFKDAADSSYQKADTQDIKENGNEKYTTLSNLTSEVTYENVYKNVNLQYIVSPAGVKENIILKDADVQNEFFISYNIGTLRAVQKDDYTITLYNSDSKEVFSIVAPYMTDGKEEYSTQLKMSIESYGNGVLEVKLAVDYWYIHGLFRSFPITIDPQIVSPNNQYCLNLNEAYYSGYSLNHGPYYINYRDITVAVPHSLYSLGDGERIVSAKYKFSISNSSSLFADENEDAIIINAHKITNYSGSAVSFSPDILDYDTVTYSDNETITFDLTKTYRDWYSEESNKRGFILEARDTVGSKTVNFNTSTIKPVLTLIYKDFKGTESSLSYHTYDVGQNATASVSDYLGNLVINQKLYEGTGSRNPISLSMTYNSIDCDMVFPNGSATGMGWQFSCNQYIREAPTSLANAGYQYIYTDSDGTEHFLKQSGNSDDWYDDDGFGFSMTMNDTEITVENGNTQVYQLPANGGRLLSETDNNGNTISYSYDGNNINRITDGTGQRSVEFEYMSGVVAYIDLPNGDYILFDYDDDYLTSVVFPDGRASVFEYDNDLLVSVQQVYQSYLNVTKTIAFDYTNDSVTRVSQYGSDNTEYESIEIAYGNDNTTTFSEGDNSITYFFSGDGKKKNSTKPDDIFVKNYLSESIEHSEVGNNCYFEPVSGVYENNVSSGGIMSITNDTDDPLLGDCRFLGTNAIKIYNPSTNNNAAFFSGVCHQIEDVSLRGKYVTFSAYVKTVFVKKIFGNDPIGATLKIKCFDSNNNAISDLNSIGIIGDQDWHRISVTSLIPENTTYFRIYCNLRFASGWAFFDGLQLEQGDCASSLNVLQNSDFENNSVWLTENSESITINDNCAIIQGEVGAFVDVIEESSTSSTDSTVQPTTVVQTETETIPFDQVDTRDNYGNITKSKKGFVTRQYTRTYSPLYCNEVSNSNVAEEANNPYTNHYIIQRVNVGKAGVQFAFSGEAQALSAPLSNPNRTFGIAISVFYNNNSQPEIHYQPFSYYTNKIQDVRLSVIPSENEIVDHVDIAFVYGYNINNMTVHNSMLSIDETDALEIPSTNSTGNESGSNSNTQPQIYCISSEMLSEAVDSEQEYMQIEKTYDENNNYVLSETDSFGLTTTYARNTNGDLLSVTDNNNNTTNYEYDECGRIKKVRKNSSVVQYDYNDRGSISCISHNGVNYDFGYDSFGRNISSTIANTNIANMIYTNESIKKCFSNSAIIEYFYDDYKRVVRIEFDNTRTVYLRYNKEGLLSQIVGDLINCLYFYNSDGNLIEEYNYNSNNSLEYWKSHRGPEDTMRIIINGEIKTCKTKDSDNQVNIVEDGIIINSASDGFSRHSITEISREGYDSFKWQYEYFDGVENHSTTEKVEKLVHKIGDNTLNQINYTYDNVGNIQSVTEGGVLKYHYSYDSYNQLALSKDFTNSKLRKYSYDGYGNIVSVKDYNLNSDGSEGAFVSQKNYVYDTTWKDKLISYNNETIEYDEIGNPTRYRDGMLFTWTNGRRLCSITKGNEVITMDYNASGLRLQKGNYHYYYNSQGNLIGLNDGSNKIFIYYDSQNAPVALRYNNNIYYYLKNIQGDILGLVNKNGTIIARYEYDAFGKILSVKNRFGNEITSPTSTAHMNPLRYRGYIYDEETSLYYLKSRYYDPCTGRFLSLDSLVDTQKKTPLSVNMYSYCENDFINKKDSTGYVMESNLEPPHYNDHENVLIKSGLTNCVNFSEYYYVGQYRSNGYMIYTYHKRGSSVMSSAAYILSFYTQTKYRSEWESDAKHLRDEANAISSVGNMILELFSFGTFCIEETYSDWTTFVPYSDYICLGVFLGSVLFNAYMTVFNPSIDYNSKKATYILRNVSQTNWTTKIEIALFAVLSYVSIGCTPTVVGEQHIYEPY